MIKIFENIIEYLRNLFSIFKTEPKSNPFFTIKYISDLKKEVEGNQLEELKIIDCLVKELREYPILQYVKACLEKEGEVIFVPYMGSKKINLIVGTANYFKLINRVMILD